MKLQTVLLISASYLSIITFAQVNLNISATSERCAACALVADFLDDVIDESAKVEDCLRHVAVNICEILKIEDNTVCNQAVNEYAEEVIYIMAKKVVNRNTLCYKMLGVCPEQNETNTQNWTLPIPGGKPAYKGYTTVTNGKPKLRVLHLTDVHFDSEYLEGSESKCGEPLCCRTTAPNMGPNGTVLSPAGRWGNNVDECDPPIRTLESAFKHISSTQDVDMIVWTGDLVAHDIWNYTREGHMEALNFFTNLLLQYFPSAAIYSATGNHEGVPCDQFAYQGVPERFSHEWLYSTFHSNWTHWFGGKEITKTIKKRASYMTRIVPGLRLISLNTIYAYNTNFWLLLNATDPDGTLNWFIEQLDQAEKAGDKVWVIGHIPNSGTMASWSKVYYDAINRYEDTVRGQFYGHTHKDQLRMHYLDMDPTKRPTAVTYMGPSITTYSGKNPGYRIYEMDGVYHGSTYSVLDHYNWFLDLDIANANPNVEPQWEFEYRATSSYGLKNLNPQDWHDFTVRMQSSGELVQLYQQYRDRRPSTNYHCNASCAHDLICKIRRNVNDQVPGSQNLCDTIQISANYTNPANGATALLDRDEISKLKDYGPFTLDDLLKVPTLLREIKRDYC